MGIKVKLVLTSVSSTEMNQLLDHTLKALSHSTNQMDHYYY